MGPICGEFASLALLVHIKPDQHHLWTGTEMVMASIGAFGIVRCRAGRIHNCIESILEGNYSHIKTISWLGRHQYHCESRLFELSQTSSISNAITYLSASCFMALPPN
jgi:hypothetical protein